MVLATAIVAFAVQAPAAAVLTIQADQPGAIISSNLFGIFFEEINFAGEGGLYAEMVRNRSFHTQAYWTLVTQGTAAGTMSVDASQPLNTNIPNSLKLTMQSGTGSVGAGNAGFWGMSLQAGATYYLNFYAMGSNGFGGPVVAQLQNAGGSYCLRAGLIHRTDHRLATVRRAAGVEWHGYERAHRLEHHQRRHGLAGGRFLVPRRHV